MDSEKVLDISLLIVSLIIIVLFAVGAAGALCFSVRPEELDTVSFFFVTIDEGYLFGASTVVFVLYIAWIIDVPLNAYKRLTEGGD